MAYVGSIAPVLRPWLVRTLLGGCTPLSSHNGCLKLLSRAYRDLSDVIKPLLSFGGSFAKHLGATAFASVQYLTKNSRGPPSTSAWHVSASFLLLTGTVTELFVHKLRHRPY